MEEGLMNQMARLKQCKEILNVANPVRPETKLEVEREIVRIMGWDVLLPSQEDYKKELEKWDKEMKKQLAEKQKPAGPEQAGLPNEKQQGQPKAQTAEQAEKRLQAGVNVRKAGSKKGKIPSGGPDGANVEESAVVPIANPDEETN
jgi:hypothetical protein